MSEEKKPTRAQIFRYFRIESRNNKSISIAFAHAISHSALFEMN